MPNLIVSINHQLPQDQALRRIQAAVGQAKVKYSDKINDLRDSWNGYVGAFKVSGMGQKAAGTVTVNPSDVTVQISCRRYRTCIEPSIATATSRTTFPHNDLTAGVAARFGARMAQRTSVKPFTLA